MIIMNPLPNFEGIKFAGELRPSQVAASSIIISQLEEGSRGGGWLRYHLEHANE